MGNVDSKLLPEGPEPGCVFYRPAHPHPVLRSNRNLHWSCTPIFLDRYQRPINQPRPVENHPNARSASAEAGTDSNGSRSRNESVEAQCPPYTCDAGHVWCGFHKCCHPIPPYYSRGSKRRQRPQDEIRYDALRASILGGADDHRNRSENEHVGSVDCCSAHSSQRTAAGADDGSNRSRDGAGSVHAPSPQPSRRSARHRSSGGSVFRAGQDHVSPVTGALSVYYNQPGQAKGLLRHQGHHSRSERAGPTSSGSSARSSRHNASSTHSRQASTPEEDRVNSSSGSSSASISQSKSHRSMAPQDQVAEPYIACGRSPQRHHRMDIFGDEHSTDDEGSSAGESDGTVGSVGGKHEAEQTHRPGYHVQFAIPEAEYQYFYTDSDCSSTMVEDEVQGAMSERDHQRW